ncbi:lipocalin family protein [Nannocystis pusilla]|uniref:Lipocalin-like domain-containing protein n=1 Tax=Nannocystis pusilla TaxID=889268 RepID=A0ABS7U452_9BACT|nr:lipocalin family protein [Nannocystis pusilla]MBZ5715335.1 hypothetical protein [Nannocystis pusilla]
MIRPASVFAFVLVACSGSPPRPLAEEILGEWEVVCRTDQESTATCLGKEELGMYWNFRAGGQLVSGVRGRDPMEGTWALSGDQLTETFEGGSVRLEEVYRARIEDGKLVLWHLKGEFGAVLGRVGAPFEPPASAPPGGGPTTHAIGGVRYKLVLPPEYRLTRDDNNRQAWSPASNDGFVVQLSLSRRPQREVEGKWVTPPCNPYDYGGVSGSASEIGGVRRDTSIGLSICLEHSEQVVMCSAEHTRGYLEKAELDAALALCRSFAVEH